MIEQRVEPDGAHPRSAELIEAPAPAVADGRASTRARWLGLLVLLAILVGAGLRVWGAAQGGEVADVAAYRTHVQITAVQGRNVYLSEIRYPYFPGWLGVELAVWALSQALKTPFWWLIRLTIVAADVLACFAVWWAARRAGGPVRGRWAAALYALSPIAILISGHHGQFDALPTLFAVLAAGLLLGPTPRPAASGLLLGLAMALKPSPALLVPVFMRAPGLSWRGRLALGALAGAVVLAVSAPYLLVDPGSVYRNVVGYPGLNDQGLGGLLRALWLYRANNIHLPGTFGVDITTTTRWTALALVAFALLALWRWPVPRVAAAAYLAFLSVFGGVSTQYLVWPLAWLLISDLPLRWAVLYSLGATAGAVGFYMVYWPQLLIPGKWAVPAVQNVRLFVAGQALSLLAIWATFAAALAPGLRRGGWRRPVLWLSLLVLLATAYPVAVQVVWLASQWIKFRG
jgi:hypothetical protein